MSSIFSLYRTSWAIKADASNMIFNTKKIVLPFFFFFYKINKHFQKKKKKKKGLLFYIFLYLW